ncbi:MAG TPA: hypothetical protein PK020_17120 [Ilumatobacteraceae bacterium]|nr:hypothetical protein [Ilumatobacteraceae bacterium]HRB03622.1 hypothetical protein [Ilumatobacteraceae bacterium]
MIKLSVYLTILVVLGIVWLVQQAQAHGRRPDPLLFRPVLGPIEHLYPVGIRNGSEVMAQAAQHVAGMSVASVSGDVLLLNSRPNVGRLDDGMGMLLRVTSWYLPDGWHVRIEGQPKASLAADASSRRGFVAVERQLRQSLAHMGYRLDDGLSNLAQPRAALPAPASVRPQWAPPVEPPPPPALSLSLLGAHGTSHRRADRSPLK